MSGSNAKVEWYLARDGQQHGPLTDPELRKFIELGHLLPSDLVWRAGFPEWRTASEVFPEIRAQKPPPPPTPAAPATEETRSKTTELAEHKPAPDKSSPGDKPIDELARERSDIVTERLHGSKQPVTPAEASTGVKPRLNDRAEPSPDEPSVGQNDPLPLHNNPSSGPGGGNAPGYAPQPQTPYAATQHGRPQPTQFDTIPGQAPGGVHPPGGSASQYANHPGGQDGRPGPAPAPGARQDPRLNPQQGQGQPYPGAPIQQQPAAHPAQNPADQPQNFDDDDFYDDYDDEPKRTPFLEIAAALIFVGMIGVGGWFAYANQGLITQIINDFTKSPEKQTPAVVSAPASPSRSAVASQTTSTQATNASAIVAPTASTPIAPVVNTSVQAPELALLTSKFWNALKQQDAGWAQRQESAISKLRKQGKSHDEVLTFAVSAVVDWRRTNADKVLTSSPAHLRSLAKTFVANLKFLVSKDVQACYGFISKGELSPAVLPLYKNAAQAGILGTQTEAIVAAAKNTGAKPTQYLEPTPPDFNKLAQLLIKRGWAEEDLKMFSDPTALSSAPAEKVCKLVTEWFDTQLQMPPSALQMRLLATSLQPVVRG